MSMLTCAVCSPDRRMCIFPPHPAPQCCILVLTRRFLSHKINTFVKTVHRAWASPRKRWKRSDVSFPGRWDSQHCVIWALFPPHFLLCFFFFSGWQIPQAKTFLPGLHSFLTQTNKQRKQLVVLNWFMKKTNQAMTQSNFLRRGCFFLLQTRTKMLIFPTSPAAIFNRRVNKWGQWGETCL